MPKTPRQDKQATGVREVTQDQLGSGKNPNEPQPKMPHERDEATGQHSTAGVENAESRDTMRQAHDDLAAGRQDTDRSPVTDKTYHELRKKPAGR